MRQLSTLALAGLLLLSLAGCGDSSNAFAWESEASEPKGDPIRILYDIKEGEGVRMQMHSRGKLVVEGPISMSQPIDVTMTMSMRCTEVRESGDRVLEMKLEDMDMSKMEVDMGEHDLTTGFKGEMIIGSNGEVKGVEMDGIDAATKQQLDQMFSGSGFQTFIPMPPEGLRVGEAIDLAKVMPKETLEKILNTAGRGMDFKPEIKGEMVLKGASDVAGEKAAEWRLNMVMNFAGTMNNGGKSSKMDMGIKMSGTQMSSLRTGFPVGSSKLQMKMRASIEVDDEEMTMDMDMAMTISAAPLK